MNPFSIKNLQNVKRDLASGQSLTTSLFRKSITKNDVQYISDFINQINSGQPLVNSWKNTMSNASVAGKKMAVAVKKGEVELSDLSKQLENSTIGLQAAGTALNAVIDIGIGVAITLISKAINYYDDLAAKVNEVKSEFNESQKEIH